MVTVSVIVPVYNSEKYLHRCIDSILTQIYNDFELLLIDDGSTDSSGTICDAYAQKDSRVHVFHKENGGVSSARNLGLDNASGEWITFVDSDDKVSNKWLLRFYESNAEKTLRLYVQRAYRIGENNTDILHKDLQGDVATELFISKDGFGYVWNKLFERKIIADNQIRFDNNIKCYEDELFVLKYCRYIESVYILPFPEYYYVLPDNFAGKYNNSFTTLLYYYQRVKKIHIAHSRRSVDSLVCLALREIGESYQNSRIIAVLCRDEISKEIKFVKGLRKIPLKLLAYTKSLFIWNSLFRIYSFLMSQNLI